MPSVFFNLLRANCQPLYYTALDFGDETLGSYIVSAFDADGDSMLNENEIKSITSLSSVTIPSTLGDVDLSLLTNMTDLGTNFIFDACSISSIILPDSLTKISAGTFRQVTTLSYIDLKNVKEITGSSDNKWYGAFFQSSVAHVKALNITYIGGGTFLESSLSRIDLPDTPPTLETSNMPFSSSAMFYLSSQEAIDTYLADETWGTFDSSRFMIRTD